MSQLTGLFQRGNAFYLRIVLPKGHLLLARHPGGRLVKSLGTCNPRDAARLGLQKRAEVLCGFEIGQPRANVAALRPALATPPIAPLPPPAPPTLDLLTLRHVYQKWSASKKPSKDTASACLRAVVLFEECLGSDTDMRTLNRAKGDEFRSWLLTKEATSKTSRDRLTWVKSLLKYAARDLEALHRNPWDGLDITHKTTARRRPWTPQELKTLFAHALFTCYELPKEYKAGKAAAYWIPLIGLYTGARISELAQLRVNDVNTSGAIPMLSISDEGEGQQVKTAASVRTIPVHTDLLRLGLLDYVAMVQESGATSLWPDLKFRDGKPGGYISAWFGTFKRAIGLHEQYPDFHCFRHTVRTVMSQAGIDHKVQDQVTGHTPQGSVGTRVYQHISDGEMVKAIAALQYPELNLPRVFWLPCGNPPHEGAQPPHERCAKRGEDHDRPHENSPIFTSYPTRAPRS